MNGEGRSEVRGISLMMKSNKYSLKTQMYMPRWLISVFVVCLDVDGIYVDNTKGYSGVACTMARNMS